MSELTPAFQAAAIESYSSPVAADAGPVTDESDELELGLDTTQDSADDAAEQSETAVAADASPVADESDELELGLEDYGQQAGTEVPQITAADNSSSGSEVREISSGTLTNEFNNGPDKTDEDTKDGLGAPSFPEPAPSPPQWKIEGL